MKFANHFAGATMIPIDFNPGPVNATAYAAKRPDGKLVLAIINKDISKSIHVDVMEHGSFCARTLKADSLASTRVLWDDRYLELGDYIKHRKSDGWDSKLFSCSSISDSPNDYVELAPSSAVLLDHLG